MAQIHRVLPLIVLLGIALELIALQQTVPIKQILQIVQLHVYQTVQNQTAPAITVRLPFAMSAADLTHHVNTLTVQ